MKLLLIIATVYLIYRALKWWAVNQLRGLNPAGGSAKPEIDDVMTQDPICGIYFPKREGVELRRNGETLYFCSTACRDRFRKEHH